MRHGSDPLIYDYSGNMPQDIADIGGKPGMKMYLRSLLSDLHGKPAKRWNVSSHPTFVDPPDDDDGSDDDDDLEVRILGHGQHHLCTISGSPP